MTTIAANLNEMAADTRMVGGLPLAVVGKLHRIGDAIFGEAGGGFEALLLIDWLAGARDRRRLFKMPDDFDRDSILIIELSAKGLALWNGWGVRQQLRNDCFAIGSGSLAAASVLAGGGSPHDAVVAAAKQDENTGLPVDVMTLANIRDYPDEKRRAPVRKKVRS